MSAFLAAICALGVATAQVERGDSSMSRKDLVDEIELRHTRSSETLETLPRWVTSSRPVQGPREARDLELGASDGAASEECFSLGEILLSVPGLSRFTALIMDAGYTRTLLNDRRGQSTLVAPIDAAFEAPIVGREYDGRYGADLSAIISERPDIMSSLVGAHVLKGLWTKDTFSSRGTWVPTSNKMGSEGSPLMMEVRSGRGDGVTFRGEGSEGSALVTDLAACGPSVVHIVDTVLLPFSWDADAQDRTMLDNGNDGRSSSRSEESRRDTSDGRGGWGGWDGGWWGRK